MVTNNLKIDPLTESMIPLLHGIFISVVFFLRPITDSFDGKFYP